MASIRRRNDLWQVQVRCRHAGSASKSFHRKTDAERWATAQEALMQSGQWKDKKTNRHTIGDMMLRYLNVVTPTKRGKDQETRRLPRLASLLTSATDASKTVSEPVSMTLFCCAMLGT